MQYPNEVDLAQGQTPFERLEPHQFYTYLTPYDHEASVALNAQKTTLYNVRGVCHSTDVQKLESEVNVATSNLQQRKQTVTPKLTEIRHQFAKAVVSSGPIPPH